MKAAAWFVSLAIAVCACDSSEGAHSAATDVVARHDCHPKEALNTDELIRSIKTSLSSKEFDCLGELLNAAKGRPPSSELTAFLRDWLEKNREASPKVAAAKAFAISYLVLVSSGQGPYDVVERNLPALNETAVNGTPFERQTAISVLSTRRSDSDIPIFVQGTRSRDDGVLVYSLMSLLDNCSPPARQALADAVHADAVRDYLKRYAGKEQISKIIASRCPINTR